MLVLQDIDKSSRFDIISFLTVNTDFWSECLAEQARSVVLAFSGATLANIIKRVFKFWELPKIMGLASKRFKKYLKINWLRLRQFRDLLPMSAIDTNRYYVEWTHPETFRQCRRFESVGKKSPLELLTDCVTIDTGNQLCWHKNTPLKLLT